MSATLLRDLTELGDRLERAVQAGTAPEYACPECGGETRAYAMPCEGCYAEQMAAERALPVLAPDPQPATCWDCEARPPADGDTLCEKCRAYSRPD